MKHGRGGYTRGGCRCEACTNAHRDAARAYAEKNRERLQARDAERYARDRASVLEAKRADRVANPEKYRLRERTRAASPAGKQRAHRRRGVEFTPEALDYLALLSGDPCSYCGTRERITVDHIDAISRGGDGDASNLTAACLSCNSSKRDDSLLRFMLRVAN